MKPATFLLACLLALTQTPATAESGLFSRGAATARIDFQVKIPHSLRLRLTPLATTATEALAVSAGAMIRTSAHALEDARIYAVSVLSSYGHVTIAATQYGREKILPPRSRAGLTQY